LIQGELKLQGVQQAERFPLEGESQMRKAMGDFGGKTTDTVGTLPAAIQDEGSLYHGVCVCSGDETT
jgi:hypothetical protein